MTAERPALLPKAPQKEVPAPEIRFLTYLHAWNLLQGQSTPQHHRIMAHWLETAWLARRRRLLLMAFRGAGKSTIVGLYCAWLLTTRPDRRILTLSADEALARRMLRTARKVIERHPLSVGVRPQVPEQWSADRFSVAASPHNRDASMLAAGLDGNITGARADVIICDDVEVPKTCETPGKRQKLRERLGELDFILTPGGTQLYIGTPHAWDSIYRQPAVRPHDEASGLSATDSELKGPSKRGGGQSEAFLQHYERFCLPLLNDSGHSAWPERFDDHHVATLRQRAGPVRFSSQMMLQPADVHDTRLDLALLRTYRSGIDYLSANNEQRLFIDDKRMVSASCWWDPAYGGSPASDSSVIACVFTDVEGHSYIHDVLYLESRQQAESIDPATAQCQQVAAFLDRNMLTSVTVESNGVGRFLPGLLRQALQRAKQPGAVVEHHTREPKVARILRAFDARMAAGFLHIHVDVVAGPFGAEFQEWRPPQGRDTSIRDDGLDAVAGCLLSEPVRFRRIPKAQVKPKTWRHGSNTHFVRA